jgi:hypothetical protein
MCRLAGAMRGKDARTAAGRAINRGVARNMMQSEVETERSEGKEVVTALLW